MNFKISLLICALHLFTTAWSVGLTESCFDTIFEFIEKYTVFKNEVPRIIAAQYLMDLGYRKLITLFPAEETGLDSKSMPEFLIAFGNLDKDTDDLRDSSFTTYEVRLFMRMFNIKDQKGVHDGFLTYAELVNLFDVDLYLEPDVKKNIKNELNSGDSINALKFLTTILKHKSKGNGLDKTQIMKVIRLYKPISGYFDDSYQQEFYNKLNIVSKDYKKLLEFEHVQPPALELQEFLVFWAEYNTEDHGNSRFFSSSDVRDFIYEFNLYDRKSDGVITFEEFKPIARTYFNEDYKCCFGKTVFDQYTGNQPEMNAAMFLNMKYYLVFNGHGK